MIFYDLKKLNLKVGDHVNEMFFDEGDTHIVLPNVVVEVRKKKTKYLLLSWSLLDEYGCNPAYNISKFNNVTYKKLLCNKLHRVIPI